MGGLIIKRLYNKRLTSIVLICSILMSFFVIPAAAFGSGDVPQITYNTDQTAQAAEIGSFSGDIGSGPVYLVSLPYGATINQVTPSSSSYNCYYHDAQKTEYGDSELSDALAHPIQNGDFTSAAFISGSQSNAYGTYYRTITFSSALPAVNVSGFLIECMDNSTCIP